MLPSDLGSGCNESVHIGVKSRESASASTLQFWMKQGVEYKP